MRCENLIIFIQILIFICICVNESVGASNDIPLDEIFLYTYGEEKKIVASNQTLEVLEGEHSIYLQISFRNNYTRWKIETDDCPLLRTSLKGWNDINITNGHIEDFPLLLNQEAALGEFHLFVDLYCINEDNFTYEVNGTFKLAYLKSFEVTNINLIESERQLEYYLHTFSNFDEISVNTISIGEFKINNELKTFFNVSEGKYQIIYNISRTTPIFGEETAITYQIIGISQYHRVERVVNKIPVEVNWGANNDNSTGSGSPFVADSPFNIILIVLLVIILIIINIYFLYRK
jgi:hypothetical protein